MTDNNKEILEKVKTLVSEKKIVQKQKDEKETPQDIPDDQIFQKQIKEWIDKNAERIAREIINDNLKKILK